MKMKTATEINMKRAELYEQIANNFRQLARLDESATPEVAVKPSQPTASDDRVPLFKHRYTLADNRIGDFAKLIKVVYEEGMFLDEEGNRADCVEDLAHYMGHCFGQDFSNWRPTLRGAFLPKNALDFFDSLKHWGDKYKASIKHDSNT